MGGLFHDFISSSALAGTGGGFRRVNCPVFPYFIAYFIRGDTVVIAAVAHGSRHPDYWKNRLE
jgi:hypothetical protein